MAVRCAVLVTLLATFLGLAHSDTRAAARSMDGDGLIAFLRFQKGHNEGIYVVRPDGTGERLLAAPGDPSFEWSPDGSRIAYEEFVGSSFQLFIVNADGSGRRHLRSACAGEMSWSPDATRIACTYEREKSSGIGVVRVDGSGFTALTRHRDMYVDDYPDWSPDGKRIAFERRTGNDRTSLAVTNADGTGQKLLTRDGFTAERPEWSPDSRRIVFQGGIEDSVDTKWDIYVISADGSDLTNLTRSDPADDHDPHWSPRGRAIVFQRRFSQIGAEVHTINADGTRHRNLTRATRELTSDQHPAWSPDGREIVFSSVRDGNFDIYVMSSAGRHPRKLTNGSVGTRNKSPAWSP